MKEQKNKVVLEANEDSDEKNFLMKSYQYKLDKKNKLRIIGERFEYFD